MTVQHCNHAHGCDETRTSTEKTSSTTPASAVRGEASLVLQQEIRFALL